MKVLFVTNYLGARAENPSAGIFVDRQARSLEDKGVEVLWFDLGRRHSPLHLFRRWRALRAEIASTRPDLLHAQYGTVVSFVSALTFHPMVVTFGGCDLLVGASVPAWRIYVGILLSNLSALAARRIICVSEELRQALWWRRARATVISRGVDLGAFTPGSRADARARVGWEGAHPIVVMDGGRDPHNKGLDVAEKAIEIVRRAIPEIEFRVIKGVQPAEIPVVLRAADVLICASRQEGSPNIVKEALACALPVVGVPVGDVPERLAGHAPCEIVERSPQSLAEAVVRVVKSGARCEGGPREISKLSLPRTAERILEVYQDALAKLPLPRR